MYKVTYMYVSLSVAPCDSCILLFLHFLGLQSEIYQRQRTFTISALGLLSFLAVSSFFSVKTSQYKTNKHKQKL